MREPEAEKSSAIVGIDRPSGECNPAGDDDCTEAEQDEQSRRPQPLTGPQGCAGLPPREKAFPEMSHFAA
jgi:hypothetical protein